ncbi:N-acetylglutamate synthase-like GNAT family acetyltransferase [Paenibacillus cellulosilyticus]|uniref:N-acetylglutamate synthase-like GNAT family acetyltransferase n=1 Tax=Paenibacillus cellulosilyticus TaxID=375489 RepID=A0A2V2YPM7_9BACL|nr:GNAT family N-acetyltransferase [Paenibacillus cellulosilyticus]PWV97304.1 N-acetylglutamate synthase-like GNAT family acetyltransferase [Paenibacillus cellulosilyticus]QKS47494.1 GNAT family N-acetyltransferase [Paenibacillus cellulosilyticus]
MSIKSSVTIRDAREEDQEPFVQLLVEAYGQYADVLPDDRWEPYKEALQGSFTDGTPIARIVAVRDDVIVGSVQLFASSEEAYGRPEPFIPNPVIRYLAVSPQARGEGIATLLIQESIRRARALGANRLNLHTSDMMSAAVRLYEHLGFERAYETDLYNGETLVKGFRIELDKAALRI